MEVCVLGRLQVVVNGEALDLRGHHQPRVVATLALAEGRTVSDDALIDVLWADDAPPSARKTMQGVIHRLRKALGAGAIERDGAGYRLGPNAADGEITIDAVLFAQRLATARRMLDDGRSPAKVADALDAASRLWRGVPYQELRDHPPSWPVAAHLEELKTGLDELRFELRLTRAATGVGPELTIDELAELRSLVVARPDRELRWWLEIEGLRLLGRAAEALDLFDQARSHFVETRGAEPGPKLQGQYQRLLTETAPGAPPFAATPRAGPRIPDSAWRAGALPPTSGDLIGRDEDVTLAESALTHSRLLTLSGIGGSGKTRIAVEVATRARRSARWVWFVDLAPLGEVDAVCDDIIKAIDQRQVERGDGRSALLHLAGRLDGLLVLDNAEHLAEEIAALVADLLAASSGLAILVTSRIPLRVRGEHRLPIAALSTGAESDSSRLFLSRARSVLPSYRPSFTEQRDIDHLCEELDGLPLAIELAAARVGVLSPAEMLSRLDDRFALLADGEAEARNEIRSSLASVLNWSLTMLSPSDREALSCLTAVPGSFAIEGAMAVVEADRPSVEGTLGRLLDASILTVDVEAAGRRFRLLESIRATLAALDPDSDGLPISKAVAEHRLVRWAVAQAQSYDEATRTGSHSSAVSMANAEHHVLRRAVDIALGLGEIEAAARIMVGLEDWWRATGRTEEGWRRYLEVIEAADAAAEKADLGGEAALPDDLWVRLMTLATLVGSYVPDTEAVRRRLAARAEQRLDAVHLSTRLTAGAMLFLAAFDLNDPVFPERAAGLIEQAGRNGSGIAATLHHFVAAWQVINDPAGIEATAAACQAASAQLDNEVSHAHAHEVVAWGALSPLQAPGSPPDGAARRVAAAKALLRANNGYLAAQHLGCVLHCWDTVAWLAGLSNERALGRRLLGLVDEMRLELGRRRIPLEEAPYLAAVAACGSSDPSGATPQLRQAIDQTVESILNRVASSTPQVVRADS